MIVSIRIPTLPNDDGQIFDDVIRLFPPVSCGGLREGKLSYSPAQGANAPTVLLRLNGRGHLSHQQKKFLAAHGYQAEIELGTCAVEEVPPRILSGWMS